MPLSPYKQKLLAAIEKHLNDQDPRLARTPTRTALRSSEPRRLPPRGQHVATLGAALLTLMLVHAIAGEIRPAASAALTCGLIVPWLVSAARAAARSATSHTRRITTHTPVAMQTMPLRIAHRSVARVRS